MTCKTLDEKDQAILNARIACWQTRQGPRVGDFAELSDGRTVRFSYEWDDSLQVSEGGTFYFGREGLCSFSGSLDPAIAKSSFDETDEIRLGHAWMFHHDTQRAHNGIDVLIPCRVYRLKDATV